MRYLPIVLISVLLVGCGTTTRYEEDMYNTEADYYNSFDLSQVDKDELLDYAFSNYEDEIKNYVANNYSPGDVFDNEQLLEWYHYSGYEGTDVHFDGTTGEIERTYISSQVDTREYVDVYVTPTGKSYHKIPNCGNMNPDNARCISEMEAIDSGKKKCSKCW